MAEWLETKDRYNYTHRKWGALPAREKNPDAVVDALLGAVAKVSREAFEKHAALDAVGGIVPPLHSHALKIPEPQLSWEQSCALVIEAFTQFDEKLGQRAAAALADTVRFHIKPAEPGRAGGSVVPSGYEGRLRAEMYMSIEGTINDAVYLAHELGHLLANDIAQEAGHDIHNAVVPHNVAEVQAMFTQNIFYDYASKHENAALRKAAHMHYTGEVTRGLYRLAAEDAFSAEGMTPEKYAARLQERLGVQGDTYRPASPEHAYPWFRDEGTQYVHTHGAAGIIAAGLYAQADRKEAFGRIMAFGYDNGMTDVLEAAGVSTQKGLGDFMEGAAAIVAQPASELHAQHLQPRVTAPQFAIR